MSTPPPKDKEEPTPPTDQKPRNFKIMIEDSKLDPETKAAFMAMSTQNEEMAKTISEMNTREQLGLRDKLIEEKLKELGEIRPDLVQDFKDEKDLGKLDDAIKLAKRLTSKYPEVKRDDKGNELKPAEIMTSIDPISKKLRADSA